MRQSLRQSVFMISVLLILYGCAHNSPEQAKKDLSDASKQCSSKIWPTTVAHMSCLDSLERPVIQRKMPAALHSFNVFSENRQNIAQKTDVINATGNSASAKYRASLAEARAVLKAHEPKFADEQSVLTKEWIGAKASTVCKQETAVEQVICIGNILRPIWERNAPETISSFDEYQQKHIGFAREYDATGANESRKRAREYFSTSIKQALTEWHTNSQRDIEAANQQDAASRAEALQTFGNILAGVAAVTLAVAEVKVAEQQPAYYTSPTHCISQNISGTVYTDCQ